MKETANMIAKISVCPKCGQEYRGRPAVSRTDGDAENGPCEPMWWNDMEQAPDEETAVRQANEKARRQWEEPNWYELGVKAPSAKEMGQECPVCTGTAAVTDEEYAAWKKELEETDGLPFE